MFKTPMISVYCVLIASILGALGQYLFKAGTDRSTVGPLMFLLSPWALTGMLCYVLVMFLFTYAFRQGGTVTVLYPIYATTFIWAAVIARVIYHHPIRPVHILGMILLLGGRYLMGMDNAASNVPHTPIQVEVSESK